MNEKKKVQWSWNRLLPIFSKFESQYSKLYYDTGLDRHGLGDRLGHARARRGAQGQARGRRGKPRHCVVGLGHGPATRPARAMTLPARAQGHAIALARGAWLVGESRYKHCIVAGERPCVATRLRYGT